ncbi:hypothetical protein RCL1_000229 [Eukaryota sp. TZLM3-RCL]
MVVVHFLSGHRETISSDLSLEQFQTDAFDSVTLLNKLLLSASTSFHYADSYLDSQSLDFECTFPTNVYKKQLEEIYEDLGILYSAVSSEIDHISAASTTSTHNLTKVASNVSHNLNVAESLLTELLEGISVPPSIVTAGSELGQAYEALASAQSDSQVLSNFLVLLNPDVSHEDALKSAGLQLSYGELDHVRPIKIADSFSSLHALLSSCDDYEDDFDSCSFSIKNFSPDCLALMSERLNLAADQVHRTCLGHLCGFITTAATSSSRGNYLSNKDCAIATALFDCLLQLELLCPNLKAGEHLVSDYSLNSLRAASISNQSVQNAALVNAVDPSLIRYFATTGKLVDQFIPVLIYFSEYGLDKLIENPLNNSNNCNIKGLAPALQNVLTVIRKRTGPAALDVLNTLSKLSENGITTASFLENLVGVSQLIKSQCIKLTSTMCKHFAALKSQLADEVQGIFVQTFNSIIDQHLSGYFNLEKSNLISLVNQKLSVSTFVTRISTFRDSPNYHIEFPKSLIATFPLESLDNLCKSLDKACERAHQLFDTKQALKCSLKFYNLVVTEVSALWTKIFSLFGEKSIAIDNHNHVISIPMIVGHAMSFVSRCYQSIHDFQSRFCRISTDRIKQDLSQLVNQLSSLEVNVSDFLETYLKGVEASVCVACGTLVRDLKSKDYGKTTGAFSSVLYTICNALKKSVNGVLLSRLLDEVAIRVFRGAMRGIPPCPPNTPSSHYQHDVAQPFLFSSNELSSLGSSTVVSNVRDACLFIKNVLFRPDTVSAVASLSEGSLYYLTDDLLKDFFVRVAFDQATTSKFLEALKQRRPIDFTFS